MASLIVRQLDDELVQRLKDQASRHGRSAEAEHRGHRPPAAGTADRVRPPPVRRIGDLIVILQIVDELPRRQSPGPWNRP